MAYLTSCRGYFQASTVARFDQDNWTRGRKPRRQSLANREQIPDATGRVQTHGSQVQQKVGQERFRGAITFMANLCEDLRAMVGLYNRWLNLRYNVPVLEIWTPAAWNKFWAEDQRRAVARNQGRGFFTEQRTGYIDMPATCTVKTLTYLHTYLR